MPRLSLPKRSSNKSLESLVASAVKSTKEVRSIILEKSASKSLLKSTSAASLATSIVTTSTEEREQESKKPSVPVMDYSLGLDLDVSSEIVKVDPTEESTAVPAEKSEQPSSEDQLELSTKEKVDPTEESTAASAEKSEPADVPSSEDKMELSTKEKVGTAEESTAAPAKTAEPADESAAAPKEKQPKPLNSSTGTTNDADKVLIMETIPVADTLNQSALNDTEMAPQKGDAKNNMPSKSVAVVTNWISVFGHNNDKNNNNAGSLRMFQVGAGVCLATGLFFLALRTNARKPI